MKRSIIVAMTVFLLLLSAVYYRHSFLKPSRPSSLPPDAFPCRFGFSLRWASIGPPHSRNLIDGAELKVYDRSGKILERGRVVLAKPAFFLRMGQSRGYTGYSIEALRDFEMPPD